jgi:hypothetical protein
MDQAKIFEIAAAIDGAAEHESLQALSELLPKTLPSDARRQILLAARASRRSREALVDAIARATEGKLTEAIETAQEAHSSTALVLGRLKNAEMLRRAGR